VDTRLSITGLLIVLLAVWRITHLLWGEDGPGDIFVRLRKFAGKSFLGRLLDCFYCLSLWIALPLAWGMGRSWLERFELWFSFSGGAILLERATANDQRPPAAQWSETPTASRPTDSAQANSAQEEHPNVVLR
jgi:hypothetical protein